VAPDVAGSIPVSHPNHSSDGGLAHRQSVCTAIGLLQLRTENWQLTTGFSLSCLYDPLGLGRPFFRSCPQKECPMFTSASRRFITRLPQTVLPAFVARVLPNQPTLDRLELLSGLTGY
jgi:hypothetical protein